jgi:hypothetical protein
VTSAFGTLRKRMMFLCCCPSCIAAFPERQKQLQRAKRMLHQDETLRPRKAKAAKEEAS